MFDNYTIYGGWSGFYVYKSDKDKKAYIRGVFETIVNRDLVQKYNLSDTQTLSHLSEFLMDNISNITFPSKITTILNDNEIVTNHVTIEDISNIFAMLSYFMILNVMIYGERGI